MGQALRRRNELENNALYVETFRPCARKWRYSQIILITRIFWILRHHDVCHNAKNNEYSYYHKTVRLCVNTRNIMFLSTFSSWHAPQHFSIMKRWWRRINHMTLKSIYSRLEQKCNPSSSSVFRGTIFFTSLFISLCFTKEQLRYRFV